MDREIFVVYNASTNQIEVQDFGLIIYPDSSVDLVDFETVYTSEEIDSYLYNGDLQRLIGGSPVPYPDAFNKELGNIQIDGSLVLGNIGDVEVYATSWNQRHTNLFSESLGSGITQIAPYDYSTNTLGNWHPWGEIIWDSSGLGSTIEYKNWSIWFSAINRPIEVDVSIDFSGYADGVYVTYIRVDSSFNTYIDISTNMDREFKPYSVFMSRVHVNSGLIRNVGNYPDIFSTTPIMRSFLNELGLEFSGLEMIIDSSSSLTRESGEYILEGVNYSNLDFYNSYFGGAQNLARFDEETPMVFVESHPIYGIDSSVEQYTDFRLHSNRYWDKDLGTFVDSSLSEQFMISAVHLSSGQTPQEKKHLIRRGSTLYKGMLDALEAVVDFEANSASMPQPMQSSFPIIGYFVHQTDAFDLTDNTQFRITKPGETVGGIAKGRATGFGQYAAYANHLPVKSTTSNTYINALSLTTDTSVLASTYRIAWVTQIANSKNRKSTWYRLTVDSSVIEESSYIAIAANAYIPFSGFQYLELGDGAHIINIDFYADIRSTAYIRDMRLEFFRAATDEIQE